MPAGTGDILRGLALARETGRRELALVRQNWTGKRAAWRSGNWTGKLDGASWPAGDEGWCAGAGNLVTR
jgi:hypothetical protein